MNRILCWLFGHKWGPLQMVTLEFWPLHYGFTLRCCERCGQREYPR